MQGKGVLRRVAALLAALAIATVAAAAGPFQTSDPLRAFVHAEYPLGSDYFINGADDTELFRCLLPTREHPFEGIALSERTIWGNRGGDWELFRRVADADFAYAGTARIADTSCLESCRSKEYLATGRCTWKRGWPTPS